MPLFFNLDLIHEAEDDQTPTDYTTSGNDDTTANAETKDTDAATDAGNDDTSNDKPDDNPEEAPEDYTVPDNDQNPDDNPDASTDEAGTDDNPDESGKDTGDTTDDSSTSEEDNRIKEIQDQIFQDLTSGQLKIKNKELKSRYFDMYENIESLVDKVNDAPKVDETIPVLNFVSNKLDELATMISDYLNQTYDTLTYIENEINFQKFMGTMNGINSVLDELSESLKTKVKNNDDE